MSRVLIAVCVSLWVGCGGMMAGSNGASDPQVQAKPQVQARPQVQAKPQVQARPQVQAKPKERVAVLDLKNQAGVKPSEIRYLSNLLRQAAGRLPQSKYSVMTKDNILVMLPLDTNLEDCVGTCAVDTGRRLGAHYILVGEVVRFGKSLRVSLNLHHSGSGELRGSDTVKGDTVESLEGPLQGTAVGLFSVLDPSLKRVAERLKRGFVFEKFQYSALPDVAQGKTQTSQTAQVTLPEAAKANVVKGVDFGRVDVDGLALYDEALTLDENTSAKPEDKLAKWQAVAKRVPAVSKQATARAKVWQAFIQERDRQAELQRQQAERERLAKAVALKKLRGLKAEDEALERKRTAQMEKDWGKLSTLIKLRVVSAEDKLNWVEAFVEAYGAVPALNPHIGALAQWTAKMNRFDDLEEEGQREAKRRALRSAEIAAKMYEVTTGIKVIPIPAGSFKMGSNDGDSDEKPVHRVEVKGFLMSETEVTVGQYRKCVEAGLCSEPRTGSSCTWGRSDDHPINCVDWGQARTFAVWAGGDLPTEAQWEYAARGGESYTYTGSNDADEVAWYSSNSRKSTHPVKTKKANGYGLYDMSGNVWEWTLDEWHDNYRGAPSRAEKPWGSVGKCRQKCDMGSSRRVSRGGSWSFRARSLRVADRSYGYPDNRFNRLGFRVRRTLP